MNTLYVMVGIPGSGKSTLATQMANKDNTIKLSSDMLRLELLGSTEHNEDHAIVFKELNSRTKKYLKKGFDVIYDATNINSKRRINLLNEFKNIPCRKVCIYLATPYDKCVENNLNRGRVIDESVILRMYKHLHIPSYYEGWDKIIIHSNEERTLNLNLCDITNYKDYCYKVLKYAASDCIELSQDNPRHVFSVSRHMYNTYLNLVESRCYFDNKHYDLSLEIASILHDIGKGFCKNFKYGSKYANFYGHENVSAQLATIYLLKCGFSHDFILKTVTYIRLHMHILNINNSKKGMEKFKNMVGDEIFENLRLLSMSECRD